MIRIKKIIRFLELEKIKTHKTKNLEDTLSKGEQQKVQMTKMMILTDLKPDEYNEYMMIFSILNGNNILTFEGEWFIYEFSGSQRYYC